MSVPIMEQAMRTYIRAKCATQEALDLERMLDEVVVERLYPYTATVRTISDEGWRLAERFHEIYERLAPTFGYRTRAESAKPWASVPVRNKQLMAATCTEILGVCTRGRTDGR
jgi:hypothetical protein